jgi:hypothetical protein
VTNREAPAKCQKPFEDKGGVPGSLHTAAAVRTLPPFSPQAEAAATATSIHAVTHSQAALRVKPRGLRFNPK